MPRTCYLFRSSSIVLLLYAVSVVPLNTPVPCHRLLALTRAPSCSLSLRGSSHRTVSLRGGGEDSSVANEHSTRSRKEDEDGFRGPPESLPETSSETLREQDRKAKTAEAEKSVPGDQHEKNEDAVSEEQQEEGQASVEVETKKDLQQTSSKEDESEDEEDQQDEVDETSAQDPEASALWDAAREGDVQQILRAIEDGADVDAVDSEGMTPLHHACAGGHEGAIAAMLNCGSNISFPAKDGSAPLHLAVFYGHEDSVRLLLNRGADVHSVDLEGSSALHNAAYRNHAEIAKILIDHGADVNAAQIVDGYTPLHLTCEHGCTASALLLLNRSANASALSNDEHSPQALAQKSEHWELAALLALQAKGHPVDAVTESSLSKAISFLSLCVIQGEDADSESEAGKPKGKKKKGAKGAKKGAKAAAAAVKSEAATEGGEASKNPWKTDMAVRLFPSLPAETQKKISWYCGQGMEAAGLAVAGFLVWWMRSGCLSAWADKYVWSWIPPKLLRILGADFGLVPTAWRYLKTGRLVWDGHTLKEEAQAQQHASMEGPADDPATGAPCPSAGGSGSQLEE